MQASLGGKNVFRSTSGLDGNSYLLSGTVSKVYYQKGTLDFKLDGSNIPVQVVEGDDGTFSAPIPVDFFGENSEGQTYGHYRPIQTGSKIVVAYLSGKLNNPIVIGVYPSDSASYELVGGISRNTQDDTQEDVQDEVLSEKHVYPSGQILYRAGSGDIAESLQGKSFRLIQQDSMGYMDDIWYTYDALGLFNDGNNDPITSKQTLAGSWLLVHEDNNQANDEADGHMTRFYVDPHGKFQMVFGNYNDASNLAVLEGSKDAGFTLTKFYDSNEPTDSSKDYVMMTLGDENKSIKFTASSEAESADQSSTLEVKSDDVYVNGKKLSDYINGVTNIDDALKNSDEYNSTKDKVNQATNDISELSKQTSEAGIVASQAAEQASQAGEAAAQAGVDAKAAGQAALDGANDIKNKIIYYTSISPESDGDNYIPGKFIHLTTTTLIDEGIIKNAYIENEAVDNSKIANLAVDSGKITDLAVTTSKIANLAVNSAQIADLAVTDAKVGTLSFDHMIGQTLDASQINVVNLKGESIEAGTIRADKLIINSLGEITSNLGSVTNGEINAGTDSSSSVVIKNLPADNPNEYTPQKKSDLKHQIAVVESQANAAISYGNSTGNDVTDVTKARDALLSGTSELLADMTATTSANADDISKLIKAVSDAVTAFQNTVNSSLSAKIGSTADGKNAIYTGTKAPASPHENDMWLKDNGDGTVNIQIYGSGAWYTPAQQAIQQVADKVDTLPKSYFSISMPTGTDYKDGDLWYKTTTDKDTNRIVYTAYKWNHDTNTWEPMLDQNSSKNYVGSEPASPLEGDFWMDNGVLKQYQSGTWTTIPTKGDDGVAGTTYYTHIAYANSADGKTDFSTTAFTGSIYIGLLSDTTQEDSTDPTKYTWSKMRGDDGTNGRDGIEGKPGADGKSTYVHFAYANSADGKTDFNVEYFSGALYVGTLTDTTQADSNTYTDYTWARLKGADGEAGANGNGIASTLIAYQVSTEGTDVPNGTWVDTIPTIPSGQYLWTRTTITLDDGTAKVAYSVSRDGKDGSDGKDGVAGKDGVGLSSTTVTYQASANGNTAPTGTWTTTVPNVPKGQYLWTKTVWAYSDSTSETGYSVAYVGTDGNDGTDGVAGKDGVGIKTTTITYAVSSSGTTAPTENWTATIPVANPGQYVWTKTVWTYTDNTSETGYSVAKYGTNGAKGADGSDGKDGVGVSGSTVTYQVSDNGTTVPAGDWVTAIPTVPAGKFLWTKTVFKYTDNTNSTAYSVSSAGTNGTNGKDGSDGKDGRGIKSSSIAYQLSNSGVTIPTGTWLSAPAEQTNAQPYLWTQTTVSYTDNTNSTSYSVSRKGDTGATGAAGKTYYTWIKYATDSSGSNISDSPTGMTYMGLAYNKETATESSTATDYTWSLIKGADGKPGTNGTNGKDGKTYYFHIAYAQSADGKTGFTITPDTKVSYNYMGTYTDTTATGSTDTTKYTWVAMFDSTKKRNFTTQPTTPYAVGDTWMQSGATYFCTTARNSGAFTASDWTMQQLTIQSLDSSIKEGLSGNNILLDTQYFNNNGIWLPFSGTASNGEYHFVSAIPTTDLDFLQQAVSLESGTTYTFSFYAKGTTKVSCFIYNTGTTSDYADNFHKFSLTSSYQRFTMTFTTGKPMAEQIQRVLFRKSSTDNEAIDITIKEMKLEKGSVATPWCLSQSEITTKTGVYKGVTLNDSGLTATAGSTTVAMNSTDGFLIKKNSGQVFHVDTAGNLTMQGDITAGNISGVNFTGNTLNLNTTLAIGANGVLSANGGKTVINNSGLTIKDGGLSVEDSKGNQTTYVGSDGTFVTNKGVFSGDVTTNKLILKGNDSDINMGGKFHVDNEGNLTAKSATLADGTINSSTINGSEFLVGNEYYSPLEGSTHNALSATNIGLRTGTSFSRKTNLATVSNSINDNYLLKTGNPIRFVGKGEADNGSDTSATSSTKLYQVVNSNVYGKLVTISATYTISNAIPSNGRIQLQQFGDPNWFQYCILPGGTSAGTHTITQTVTLPTVSSSNTDNLRFRGETNNYTGDVIISHVKLELGSEATPWNASESDNEANAQISGIPNIISPLTDADDLLWKSYGNAELYGLNSYDTTPTAQTIDASWPSDKYIVHAYNDWSAMRYTSPSGEVFKAGQTYTVAFRARTYTGTKTTGLTFSVYALSTSTEIAHIINPIITPQFTWYQVSFTLTSDIPIDNFRIEPHGDWSDTGGSIYLCDMSIIKGNIVYGVDLRFPFQITSQNPTDISVTPVTIDTRNLSSGRTLIITTEVLYNNNYSSIGGTIQVQIGDTIKSILAQKYSIINGYETFTYSIDWNDTYQVGSNVPVTLLFSSLESGNIFVNYVNAYSVSTTLDTNAPIADSYGYITPYGELRLGYSTTSTNADNNNMLSDTSTLNYYGGILKLNSTNYDTISAKGIDYRTDVIYGGYTTNEYNGDTFYSSSIDASGLSYVKTSDNPNITSKQVAWGWDEIANSSPSGIGMGKAEGAYSWFDTRDGFDVYPNLISNSSFLNKITNWNINNGKFYWTGSSLSDGCFCVEFNNGGGGDDMWQHIYTFPSAGHYLTLSFWAFCWDSDTSNYGSHGMQLIFEQSNGNSNAGATFKMYKQPAAHKWTRYSFSPIEITSTMTSNLDHLSLMFHTDNANGHWTFARPMLNIGKDPKPYKFT
jgi:hypothetical protein